MSRPLHVVVMSFPVQVTHSVPRPLEGPGTGTASTESAPATEWVQVEVDMRKLANQYGVRACRSKGGRSRACNGAVVVKKAVTATVEPKRIQ